MWERNQFVSLSILLLRFYTLYLAMHMILCHLSLKWCGSKYNFIFIIFNLNYVFFNIKRRHYCSWSIDYCRHCDKTKWICAITLLIPAMHLNWRLIEIIVWYQAKDRFAPCLLLFLQIFIKSFTFESTYILIMKDA